MEVTRLEAATCSFAHDRRHFNSVNSIEQATLFRADLRQASLISADLTQATLIRTNLSEAHLGFANLSGRSA
jgi:uncharacterized protein YjbI with pentapeptide repeats